MTTNEFDFFKGFLPEEFLQFYDGLVDDIHEVGYNFDEFYEMGLIKELLKDETKLYTNDIGVWTYNVLIYVGSVLFSFRRRFAFEEYLKWSFEQINEEYECLKLLKRAFRYSSNSLDKEAGNTISKILLLLCTLDFVRKERVNLDDCKLTSLECQSSNVSVQFFNEYNDKDLNDLLDKVKIHAKKLQR